MTAPSGIEGTGSAANDPPIKVIFTGPIGTELCGLAWPILTGIAAWVHGIGVDWITRRTRHTWEEDR